MAAGEPLHEPADDAAEPREHTRSPDDFHSRLAPAPWHRAITLDGGYRVRIVACMGACPLERVDVDKRPDALVITLFERRPPRFAPDGTEYIVPAVGITTSFDLVLDEPVGQHRLLDGATGRDPELIKPGDYGEHGARTDALRHPATGPRVEVPIGRSFDWAELTGRPWFKVEPSEPEPERAPAHTAFFSSSEDFGPREGWDNSR